MIELTDDGTMDTVLVCSLCGQEFRGTYDGVNDRDSGDDYNTFVAWFISDVESEHYPNSDTSPCSG